MLMSAQKGLQFLNRGAVNLASKSVLFNKAPLSSYQMAARQLHTMGRQTMMLNSMSKMTTVQHSARTMMMFRSTTNMLAMRSFFTAQRQHFLTQNSLIQPMVARDFSLKMRRVNEKKARVKKYKLKTKKAFQKRFRVCGSLRNRMFKFQAQGYRHLNRNKTNRNLKRTRGRFLTTMGDIKKAKKFLPYFRKRKSLFQ